MKDTVERMRRAERTKKKEVISHSCCTSDPTGRETSHVRVTQAAEALSW